MYKFAAILLLFGAVASGQSQQGNNNITNIDEYINQNRQQYAQNLRDYDQRIDILKKTYSASLQVIPKRMEMIVDSVGQTDQRLKSLEILSDLSQQCVKKYRSNLPNVIIIKQQINLCYSTASSQTDYLLVPAFGIRTDLDSYYKYQFEGNLQSCKTQIGDYNTCVINAVSNANAYTASNRKSFDSQMQATQKSADNYIDNAFQCIYKTQNQAITSLAEIDIMVGRCLKGLDNCQPCTNQGYTCPYVSYIQRSQVDYENPLMSNLFYGRYDATNCLFVKVLN